MNITKFGDLSKFSVSSKFDDIEKKEVFRISKAIFKIKEEDPKKKKLDLIKKLVRKIWTKLKRTKEVNINNLEFIEIF
jgi:hypothetical protein